MRIGFLLSSFYPFTGGRETITFNQARELAKRGHEVHVFTSLQKGLKKDEIVEKIHIHRSKTWFKYKYYLEFNPGWVWNAMRLRLDILHVQSFGFVMADKLVLLKKLFTKTRLVNTPHGPFMALEKYPLWQAVLKKVYTAFEYPVNRLYDAVIQVNPEQWKWMVKTGARKERIHLIPNSIPAEMFASTKHAAFEHKYNLHGKLVISYVGRIQKYKGLDQVISVLPSILKKHGNVVFLAMGKDADDMARLKKMAAELKVEKNVVFTGPVTEEEKLQGLDISHIFVFPSEWEAFGICVAPDTLINVPNGVKLIKDIAQGEKVLTHNGGFMNVKKIISRAYSSNIIKLHISNDTRPLFITPEHPIMAVKTQRCAWKHKIKHNVVCKPCCPLREHCLHKFYETYKTEWIKAGDLVEGDFIASTFNNNVKDVQNLDILKFVRIENPAYFKLEGNMIVSQTGHNLASDISYDSIAKALRLGRGTVYRVVNSHSKVREETRQRVLAYLESKGHSVAKITIPRYINLNKDTLRLFGYYLAEGNVGTNGQVEFSFHAKETAYAKDVLGIMKQEFGLTGRIRKRKENCIVAGFNSVIIAGLFKALFGDYARNKRVPDFLMSIDKHKQAEMLKGYWSGNGCIMPTGFSIGTVSPNLAYQFREILLRQGIGAGLQVFKRERGNPCNVLSFGGIDLEAASTILGIRHPFIKARKRKTAYCWFNGNRYFVRVKSTVRVPYKGKVYNLEVDKDNSYVGQSVTMHNCLVEAMARGNALISTKTEGGKYLIKEGVNGYLYDYKDTNALEKCLLKLLDDEKERNVMISNNIKKARQFTVEKVTDELEKLYKLLLK